MAPRVATGHSHSEEGSSSRARFPLLSSAPLGTRPTAFTSYNLRLGEAFFARALKGCLRLRSAASGVPASLLGLLVSPFGLFPCRQQDPAAAAMIEPTPRSQDTHSTPTDPGLHEDDRTPPGRRAPGAGKTTCPRCQRLTVGAWSTVLGSARRRHHIRHPPRSRLLPARSVLTLADPSRGRPWKEGVVVTRAREVVSGPLRFRFDEPLPARSGADRTGCCVRTRASMCSRSRSEDWDQLTVRAFGSETTPEQRECSGETGPAHVVDQRKARPSGASRRINVLATSLVRRPIALNREPGNGSSPRLPCAATPASV